MSLGNSLIMCFAVNKKKKKKSLAEIVECGWHLAEWLERLTASAEGRQAQ